MSSQWLNVQATVLSYFSILLFPAQFLIFSKPKSKLKNLPNPFKCLCTCSGLCFPQRQNIKLHCFLSRSQHCFLPISHLVMVYALYCTLLTLIIKIDFKQNCKLTDDIHKRTIPCSYMLYILISIYCIKRNKIHLN